MTGLAGEAGGTAPPETHSLCSGVRCHAEATHLPLLRFWALGMPKVEGQDVSVAIDLPLCWACARDAELYDVLTDEGWEEVVSKVTALGHVEPDRASAEMTFKPISSV